MATPAFEKTWTHTQVIVPGNADGNLQYRTLLLAVKNMLKTHGWTVLQSSKPTTTSWAASDLWSIQSDLTLSGGAGAYIVLQSPPGLTPPWYLYIGLPVLANYMYATIQASKALYAPGAWNVAPSSVGAKTLISNTNWCATSAANTQFVLHGLVSSDMKHSRIIGCTGSRGAFLIFGEEMADTQGAYNSGVLGWSGAANTTNSGNLDVAGLYTATYMTCSADAAWEANTCATASFSAETYHRYEGSYLVQQGYSSVDPIDSTWPMGQINVFSASVDHFGERGRMKDLYWGATANTNGTTYPDSAGGLKGWVKVGGMIVPACGDVWALA